MALGAMPPIPTWFEPVEPDAKYPLMLCSPKSRARTHSIHGNQPLLARVDPDDVWMNPDDAARRGIVNGQKVRVFNDRGSTLLPVKITPRIAAGVVSIKEGAWFSTDSDGIDTTGCANALAVDRSASRGATSYNTNLVEVIIAG
jgi:anaerobic dimethyl sulfoxide reductase subunit A